MSELPLTITEAAAALRGGTLTSVELTQAVFERADRLDPKLGVYLQRMDTSALDEARQADADLANGLDRGPLQGIPLGIKDIIDTDNAPTTAQSLVLDPTWGDQGDAPVVARLRAAGAVITRKTTTMEFATGLPDLDLRMRWSDYGVHTRDAVAQGALYSASDVVQAQRVRHYGKRAIAELMQPFDETTVLRVGDAFQQLTDWHLRLAPLVMEAEPVLA